ncbi:mandelate racemase/muconate lactonizing enzyme family protein [Enterovibrio coralii]|uniref:Mandelate racemase n=1 Tax=Enterovibrio coralii TaxID=294935 RepID=A0A135I903_9GAMM|nr:enolase C-terminal domain-like protein [Enterovibrio coralii]KXF81864.1 mandelate racemase [Enterovibrio coralii]
MPLINQITVWKLELTSHTPYYMANGKTCVSVPSIIMRVDTDEGISGWGEVCPIPHYLAAYADGVLPALQNMSEVLLGTEAVGPEAVMAIMDRYLIGHRYAKSVIDMALWDITAKKADMPLYQLLGGKQTEKLPLYKSLTCTDTHTMVEMALHAYNEGIRQFQVKLGAENDWVKDVERLTSVRDAVGPGPLVFGDWNCGSSQRDAIRAARAVSHLDIMIEQPCATLESCNVVRQNSGLAMKLDESAHDIESLLHANQLGCMDAAAIKLSKFGGLSKARRARDLCESIGTQMVIEDTWGNDITTAASMHLATATDSRNLMNVCNLSEYVSPRLDESCYQTQNGYATVSDRPGLGVNPDLSILGEPLAILSQ